MARIVFIATRVPTLPAAEQRMETDRVVFTQRSVRGSFGAADTGMWMVFSILKPGPSDGWRWHD